MTTIKFVVGLVPAEVSTAYLASALDTWESARQQLLSLVAGAENAADSLRTVTGWPDPTFRSIPDASGNRLFLYPVVDVATGLALACPRCLGMIEATEVRHGQIVGPEAEVAFKQTMPTGYRVNCQGNCDAESDESTHLLDALDGFMRAALWPRGDLDLLEAVAEENAPPASPGRRLRSRGGAR